MEYFYTPPAWVSGEELTIEGDEFNHLTHVMRRRIGDIIRVVDGLGNAYDAVIGGIAGKKAVCRIEVRHAFLNEPRMKLTLGVGLLKNPSRFDFLVEKATELGVSSIVPLITERTIPKQAKTGRWQKLALAAMKQSGRCILPAIGDTLSLQDFFLAAPAGSYRVLPHEKAIAPIGNPRDQATHGVVCIGPEGGFTEDEVQEGVDQGFMVVTLGSRRLRTETAAITTVGRLLEGQ